MGRSFSLPTSQVTGAEDVYHDLSDTHFSMALRDGRYYQRRWQIGPDGAPLNVEELSVDYVMGSGNHARSYLHRTPRGTLIELPLGWYSEGGPEGHWAMVPGSDTPRPRTRRFISYKCMFCHNAVPQIPPTGEAPVFVGALPQGIDCQRCHGPGGKHVQAVQTRGATVAAIRASIVNPARLSPQRRMEICMTCHLETTSARLPAQIIRFNRGPFSFLPGEPLENFMLNFDHAPGTGHDDKFEIVSSVYRLRKSQCFLKSGDRLTCDTCHNPHSIPRGEAAVVHYRGVCRQCHTNAHASAQTNCVECHMPKRRPEDTPGLVITDHLIQRRAPSNLTAPFRERPVAEYHGEVVPYYPPVVSDLYRAVAQVGLGNNVEKGEPMLRRAIAAQHPAEAEFYMVLGDYKEALKRKPDSVAALLALGSFAQAVRAAPDDATAWYRLGLSEGSAEKIRNAIALDASLPDQSRSLAEILMKDGHREEAQSAVRDALRTDPFDDVAWVLQARLYAETGKMPDADFAFQRALKLAPGNAAHHHDYALFLARSNRFAEAYVHAALAESHELMGALYEQDRKLPEAIQEYREAAAGKDQAIAERARKSLQRLGAK